MHKLTYFLLVLVLGTLAFSAFPHRNLTNSAITPQNQPDQKKINERFPSADYDNQDLSDPKKNAKRKRYNDGKLVYSKIDPSMAESVFTPEPHFTFPALPVAESDLVVVGTIGSGQAHVSENKRNIFSEFTLIVESVLKSKDPAVVQGSVLTVDRIGGHVKYPNGQKVLYRVFGMNMPQTGSRYLVFLTPKHDKADLSILTAYELTPEGVAPLDEELPQVRNLTGVSEKDILQRVRELLPNASN
ncbi:MAG TPA: hypothetical protein VJS13_08410 [Pyrinomonadaceae bacterium]|nr:hypothetical protein [Pyrinomonadaceae bacterium]